MKKILSTLLLSFFVTSLLPAHAFAANSDVLKRKDAFIFFAEQFADEVPESYNYIDLKYLDVNEESELGDALQILVYLNLMNNAEIKLNPHSNINVYTFEKLAERTLKVKIAESQSSIDKKSLYMTKGDLESISEVLKKREEKKNTQVIKIQSKSSSAKDLGANGEILFDVFNTLKNSHYDKSELTDEILVEGAIKWMTESLDDRYTTYFPPVESETFLNGLDGEFEGIWAYVDMPTPGEMIIVTPIVGSPAEKAGLKGGDRVTHVDGKEITTDNSLREVITWIKGPAGSKVLLTIQRDNVSAPLEIEVTRAKIVIKDVEYKLLDAETFYVQMKNFWIHSDTEFQEMLSELAEKKSVKKIIFDLRNNPGGYLEKVSNILSHAVPKGEATAIVSNGKTDLEYKSLGLEGVDFSKYKLIFLQNSGTASASEIMIGTMKDYYPNSIIIGEQSFGKGSVQSLKSYRDGSTLKYTSAKWFTGKNRNGIDGTGITPDVQLEFDINRWKNSEKDNQLEEALKQ